MAENRLNSIFLMFCFTFLCVGVYTSAENSVWPHIESLSWSLWFETSLKSSLKDQNGFSTNMK